MRNFLHLAAGLDTTPILHSLATQPHLWDQNRLRTMHPGTAHSQVSDIWLRFQDIATVETAAIPDQHESVWYPAIDYIPAARGMILDLARRVEAERIGRCIITRLPPGKRILPHVDGGDHAAYYSRYQISLQGLPGSMFRAGDETVQMRSGDVWWFDNAIEHEVVNNSADDRIHMIVDLRVTR